MNTERLRELAAWRYALEPVALDVDGNRYVVATNNQALVAIANADCEVGAAAKPLASSVPGWIREVLKGGTLTPWAELAAFLRKGHEPIRRCPDCGGDGYSECGHCGNEATCKACRGAGQTGGQSDYILVLDAPFNAALVAQYVEGLEADQVRVALVECGALAIAEPNGAWIAITMPMIDDTREKATRRWPEVTQ